MSRILCLAAFILIVSFVAGAAMASAPPYPIKWSQPAFRIPGDSYNGQPVYLGWDDPSVYPLGGWQEIADDWKCTDNLPVTDIHWWGSYVGWMGQDPNPPAQKPVGFWFGMFSDVPANPNDPQSYSYPGALIWQWQTSSWIEEFVGYDRDPISGQILDSTFQYSVIIPRENWFYQTGEDTILWLSIQAIYPNDDPPRPYYCWGWKLRPHYFNDDAVYSYDQPPGWRPYYDPAQGVSWDMAFELSTIPEPCSLLVLASGIAGTAGLLMRRRS